MAPTGVDVERRGAGSSALSEEAKSRSGLPTPGPSAALLTPSPHRSIKPDILSSRRLERRDRRCAFDRIPEEIQAVATIPPVDHEVAQFPVRSVISQESVQVFTKSTRGCIVVNNDATTNGRKTEY